jgi:hypothetical protein
MASHPKTADMTYEMAILIQFQAWNLERKSDGKNWLVHE